jgi:MoxR-like ATPase
VPVRSSIKQLANNIKKAVIGKDEVVDLAVVALLARGHVLLEDVPGLGKTLLARSLATSMSAAFSRIQFTPDLLPADVTGVSIFDPENRQFDFRAGPVFTEILLADEINRTSPRTQSALLEAMEERQVTVDGSARALSDAFFVIATQNPIELAGTYPLPEAQLDRFLVRLTLGYPEEDAERRILEVHGAGAGGVELGPVTDLATLRAAQAAVGGVAVNAAIRDYVVALARASREHDGVVLGVSPRGSLALLRCAQARAWYSDRDWVGPDDVKAVAPAVLGHRLMLEARHEVSGQNAEDVVRELLERVPVPMRAMTP